MQLSSLVVVVVDPVTLRMVALVVDPQVEDHQTAVIVAVMEARRLPVEAVVPLRHLVPNSKVVTASVLEAAAVTGAAEVEVEEVPEEEEVDQVILVA
jgi:hydroxymethylpyrimidine/phosphomethylpyrimidine kinase